MISPLYLLPHTAPRTPAFVPPDTTDNLQNNTEFGARNILTVIPRAGSQVYINYRNQLYLGN